MRNVQKAGFNLNTRKWSSLIGGKLAENSDDWVIGIIVVIVIVALAANYSKSPSSTTTPSGGGTPTPTPSPSPSPGEETPSTEILVNQNYTIPKSTLNTPEAIYYSGILHAGDRISGHFSASPYKIDFFVADASKYVEFQTNLMTYGSKWSAVSEAVSESSLYGIMFATQGNFNFTISTSGSYYFIIVNESGQGSTTVSLYVERWR